MLSNLYAKSTSDNGTKTFSRDGQDRYVVDKIFPNVKYGYFLDIGALDGLYENNTLLMEKYYNWEGICCECDPRDIEALSNNRECNIMSSPMYNKSGVVINFEMHKAKFLSGITGHQLEKYHSSDSKYVSMTTVSLNDCIDNFNAPKIIEYMSLDTEGSEYEILSTLNFDKYKINYIGVEHNFQSPKRENIRSLLEKNGYVYHRSVMHDDDYIRKDYATKNNIKNA